MASSPENEALKVTALDHVHRTTPSRADSVFSSGVESACSTKRLKVVKDIAANERLAVHLRSRLMVSCEERTLLAEMHWHRRDLEFLRSSLDGRGRKYAWLCDQLEWKRRRLALLQSGKSQ